MKASGRWTYLYRAIGQYGQVIDVLLPERRDLDELVPSALHTAERYASNRAETDHGSSVPLAT